ncbi:MAG: L,D-transpeptidase family protein [Pseudolabrys sp.]|nr:L,D-transpeptidase family protein [Pseudolabrys sp.]
MIQVAFRALTALAAVVAAVALAGCDADKLAPNGRALAPLSEKMLATMAEKNMDKGSPILVRIFKEESELEVWKKNRDGEFALLKTYPICRWSGDLGPKKREGDRQAPEGFYTITPAQMNPNSNYYLAFNTGFPNAYDRAHGYTGSELMVHGDCSSRGCYAMTDEQIQEIYALAREAFFGGQKEFQLQAFPFRMTALNMARHRNNPNFAFWKMLKEGYDDFEATHQEPKVAVCERRYVFDAVAPENATKPLTFNPIGKCPAYRLDPAVADAILDHRRDEQVKMANYIARGVETVPPRTGIDGGMNPVFAAKLASYNVFDNDGRTYQVAGIGAVPGALPHVPNPPGASKLMEARDASTADAAATTSVPMPPPAPLPKANRVAPQGTATASRSLDKHSGPPAAAEPSVAADDRLVKPKQSVPSRAAGVSTPLPPKSEPRLAKNASRPAPAVSHPAQPSQAKPAENEDKPAELHTAYSASRPSFDTLPGAQPVVPAGSFDARWSALR